MNEPPSDPRTDLTIHELALIREAILTVIDDGWKCDACDLHHAWRFNSKDAELSGDDESFDDKQRLRFCDSVANYLVDKLAPALKGKQAAESCYVLQSKQSAPGMFWNADGEPRSTRKHSERSVR